MSSSCLRRCFELVNAKSRSRGGSHYTRVAVLIQPRSCAAINRLSEEASREAEKAKESLGLKGKSAEGAAEEAKQSAKKTASEAQDQASQAAQTAKEQASKTAGATSCPMH